jgi:5-methylthioadenosine/S-adenosylhomocysteine deaminase
MTPSCVDLRPAVAPRKLRRRASARIQLALVLLILPTLIRAAEQADWIITARYVVPMDAQRRVIENGAIAVRGERIVAVGPAAEIRRDWTAKQHLDNPDAIVAPGLVNTHTHAPMSLLRGIADDRRLQDWLEKFIFPAEARNVTPEFVRAGTLLACAEMLLSGTTTYTDMYYFEEVIADTTKQCGMRGVLGQTIIRFPVPDAKTPAEGLKRTEAFIQRFRKDPLIVPAVAPHAVYTNDDATLQGARALANRYDVPLLIHLSETKRENDELRAQRKVSPTQLLDRLGVLNGRTVAAHAVWTDSADHAILRARGTGVAHCPSSNMKLASGIAPVLQLLNAGIATGLGTDGPAGSNNDFDMFEEMDLAAKLQKVATGDPEVLNARTAFAMATVDGARALGLSREIGSLEPGKRADLIAITLTAPHAQPMYDVYSQLVYALKGSDVRHVMVNGRLLVRDRVLLTLNMTQVLANASEFRSQVQKSLITR